MHTKYLSIKVAVNSQLVDNLQALDALLAEYGEEALGTDVGVEYVEVHVGTFNTDLYCDLLDFQAAVKPKVCARERLLAAFKNAPKAEYLEPSLDTEYGVTVAAHRARVNHLQYKATVGEHRANVNRLLQEAGVEL